MNVDMRVLELLSSKICHDLVSPVSAINNGVELIEDIGGDVVDEAMKLIGASAGQAARKLKMFRITYGRAGSEGHLPLKEIRSTVDGYLSGSKITLNWPETLPNDAFVEQRGALKTLANLFLIGEEVLAYGGTLSLKMGEGEHAGMCTIEAVGRNAHLSPSFLAALEGTCPIEELSPRTIQSYVTGRFAESFGLRITSSLPEQDHLDLHLAISSAEYHINPSL